MDSMKVLCVWCWWWVRMEDWKRWGKGEKKKSKTSRTCVANRSFRYCVHIAQQPTQLFCINRVLTVASFFKLVFELSIHTHDIAHNKWRKFTGTTTWVKRYNIKENGSNRRNKKSNKEKKTRWNQQESFALVAWLCVCATTRKCLEQFLSTFAQKLIYLFTYEKVKQRKNFACSSHGGHFFFFFFSFSISRTIVDTQVVCSHFIVTFYTAPFYFLCFLRTRREVFPCGSIY